MSWASLRERTDEVFRSRRLAKSFIRSLPQTPKIVDLAGGTGANYRYLSEMLPVDFEWTNADCDTSALQTFKDSLSPAHRKQVNCCHVDLATDLPDQIAHCDGLVCSAFLDLASQSWLETFLGQVAEHVPCLLSMVRELPGIAFSPTHPDDKTVITILEAHQKLDHGFGNAAGNDTCSLIQEILGSLNCKVEAVPTTWELVRPAQTAMLQMFLGGIERRVQASAPTWPALSAWMANRQEQLRASVLSITVYHTDFLVLPDHGP